ncbi:type II secretion system F family protein [Luteitalea pratensis]|nr:type II secretion system F family protein [Luteitalea pratensis]
MIVLVGGVFVAVAGFLTLGGFAVLNRLAPERRRLEGITNRGVSTGLVVDPGPSLAADDLSSVEKRLAKLVPKSPKDMGRLQRQMALGGFHGYLPAAIFVLVEITLPLIFGAIPLLWLGFSAGLILAFVLAAVGYVIPGLYLSHLIRGFKKEIRNGLPDALDLLIVCIEAGSGLDQAILKATEELAISYPRLSTELGMITTEIRAGKPRLDAFRNFAERTKVEDVQSLVAMLVQTDRFGTSIAQALRTHADVLRTKRRQRAEEKAAKLGVKLVFPLVFCLFPALYVVTLGPAVIQFVRVFFGQVAAD